MSINEALLRVALEAIEWTPGDVESYCPWCFGIEPEPEPMENDYVGVGLENPHEAWEKDHDYWDSLVPQMGHRWHCKRQIALGLQVGSIQSND